MARRMDARATPLFQPALGFNVLLERDLGMDGALGVPVAGGGTYFLLPWNGLTLAGTHHEPWPGEDGVGPALLERFLDAYNNLGTTLAELGRHDEAILAFREVLSRDADNAFAHFNLADELETTGCPHDARAHWEAYLRFDRTSPHAAHARSRLA